MHPLDKLFKTKPGNILSIYFTAGYPFKDSTTKIMTLLDTHGADIIEIGLPFSDPLADGPTIQQSSQVAIRQGVSIKGILNQLSGIKVQAPIVMMGYLNPVLQYGFGTFLHDAAMAGVSGLILPDLPPDIFEAKYQALYEQYGIYPVFLVSPQTPDERIRRLDALSKGFLYAVSTSSTTGKTGHFGDAEAQWFERLKRLKLQNPVLAGFGIADHQSLNFVFDHLPGAVVGSSLIKSLDATRSDFGIPLFMNKLLNRQL